MAHTGVHAVAVHAVCPTLAPSRQLTSDPRPHLVALLQYAATLPAMLDFADSRKWSLVHDQASKLVELAVCMAGTAAQ